MILRVDLLTCEICILYLSQAPVSNKTFELIVLNSNNIVRTIFSWKKYFFLLFIVS